jgi:hypothetical protein
LLDHLFGESHGEVGNTYATAETRTSSQSRAPPAESAAETTDPG